MLSTSVASESQKMTRESSKIPRKAKKDHIVETAFSLFKANGFYATGVDLIMRQANVSKRTLYKYFPTKNALIVAVLGYYQATYQDRVDNLVGQQKGNPLETIRAIFEDAKTWFHDGNFHGCLAVNAMGEFSGKDQSIENSCIRFKQWEVDVLRGLSKEMDANYPDQLAYKLFVLLEGMSSIAHVTKGSYPVDMTEMANEIIEKHLDKG